MKPMPQPGSARLTLLGILTAGSFACAVYFAAHAYRPVALKPPPQQRIAVSVTIEQTADFARSPKPVPEGALVATVPDGDRVTRSTIIDIHYDTPIDVNTTAAIEARLRQGSDSIPLKGPPGAWQPDYSAPVSDMDPPRHTDAAVLPFAVVLRLEGLGLEWTQQDIPIRMNTPLPVTVGWDPRAKGPGDYTLRLPLRDINHAVETHGYGHASDKVIVTVNGVEKEHGGSDDVMMPLSVHKYGLNARELDFATLLGSIFSALFGAGCLTKLIQSWLGRKRD